MFSQASRTRTRHLQLFVTLPNHYTTKVHLGEKFLFNAFSTENPLANAVKDDRAA